MTPGALFAWALALGGCACVAAVTTLVVVSCVRGITSALRPIEQLTGGAAPADPMFAPGLRRAINLGYRTTRPPLDS